MFIDQVNLPILVTRDQSSSSQEAAAEVRLLLAAVEVAPTLLIAVWIGLDLSTAKKGTQPPTGRAQCLAACNHPLLAVEKLSTVLRSLPAPGMPPLTAAKLPRGPLLPYLK